MLTKGRFNRAGVSEVVGTILVLLITVIIFSSIILWVYTIPTPTATGRVSFDGRLVGVYQTGTWQGAYVNLTHLGGDNLFEGPTRVYLTINDRTEILRTQGTHFDGVSVKPYGISGPDATWNIGEVWSYRNESVAQNATVSVIVVDLDRGIVLWDETLLGADGAHAPVFLDKWVDADPATPVTRDPAAVGESWTLYAMVIDPDEDLHPGSVYAYLTFGSGSCPAAFYALSPSGEGTFSRTFGCSAQAAWDGGVVILNATDLDGHESRTRLIFRVGQGGGGSGGGGGSVILTTFGFGTENQRYDVFEEQDWDDNGWNATGTRTFVKGQGVVVVVVSQYLKNVEVVNELLVYDQMTLPVTPVVYGGGDPSDITAPSNVDAFTYLGFVDDFYVYEARFNTDSSTYGFDGTDLVLGQYSLEVEMQGSAIDPPNNRFATVDAFSVTDAGGGGADYPKLELFADEDHTQPTTTFNATDIVYVKVTVQDTDPGVDVGDVVVSDNLGGVQIWAQPGNPPVSAVAVNDSTSYAFSVDLAANNLDNWLFGSNTYSFRIKRIADINEEYHLSSQVTVRGPRWKLDAISSLEEFTFLWFGSDETWYSTFYENDGFWTRTIVEYHRDDCNSFFCRLFGSDGPEWGNGDFLDVMLQDLDEDGDLDAVYGLEAGRVFWYRNADGVGHKWERHEIDNLATEVTAVAAGQLDRDTDADVVAGTNTGEVWYYENDGQWSPSLIDDVTGSINDIKIADVTGDGFNDLVVATSGGQVRIYVNNGFGVFGDQDTTDYDLVADLPVEGVVTGTYANTQSDNDVYQSIAEVIGPGEVVQHYAPGSEVLAFHEDPPLGSYVDLAADDGVFQEITEGVDDLWGLGIWIRYLMRASNRNPPGHQYVWSPTDGSAPPSLGAGDTAYLIVNGYISDGTEPFTIAFCDSCGPYSTLGTLTETSETTKIFDLTAAGYTGGNIRVSVHDTDISTGDTDSGGDGMQTTVSIDYMSIQVVSESGETSRLEHRWRTQTIGAGGDAYKVLIQAHYDEAGTLVWYDPDWSYRKQIIIDSDQVTGDLTNFPILVRLASDADLAAGAQADGSDILFTASDGGTKLSHEIEAYDGGTGALVAWVKVPVLSGSSDTILYMYYGNPSASSQEDAPGVWSNGYLGVWHLSESSGNALDSTGNGNDGTVTGVTQGVAGNFGDAYDFNAYQDGASVAAPVISITRDFTVSAWVYDESSAGEDNSRLVEKWDCSGANMESIRINLKSPETNYRVTNDAASQFNQSPDVGDYAGVWASFAMTWNGATVIGYRDGAQETSGPLGGNLKNSGPFTIGNSFCEERSVEGLIDEVRLSNVPRSSTWIQTEFNNQLDPASFLALGAETESIEVEGFLFQWAASTSGPWNDLVTVTTTVDGDTYQTGSLPNVGGSQIYLRAIDEDRVSGNTELDTLHVDHVVIRRFITIPDVQVISVGSAVRDLAVGDVDGDGAVDIVAAASDDARVYFGPSWAVVRTLTATGTVYSVDVGYIDGDENLDVVTGSNDGNIYWFANDGSWARSHINAMGSAINSLRVGDVDGDYWDDVVVATEEGYIRLFRHDRGTSWVAKNLEKLDTAIRSIDIGDVDRGVVIHLPEPPP